MQKAAAMIIPSHGDSLPLTFGEAMQADLPVICSRVGDMPHYIDKYNVGFHYPAGDVARLCDRMGKMIRHFTELGKNCRGFVEEICIATSAREISGWLDGVRERQAREWASVTANK
jgi:glycosyltransferase involved in cell wall biosynthesis